MKKIIACLLTLFVCLVAVFTVTACDGGGKPTTTMTNYGKVLSNDGMVAETENYIYYINGIGTSTDDNSFGKPLKGALMVADKSTLDGEVKTEVVVPKLFVASDYKAGIFLSGEGENAYVYYGTPSVEKDSSGNVATGHLTFMRTKLDGSKTESFFTVEGIGASYRIAEKDGEVYIVYFDKTENALKSYNTAKKSATVIAKVDEKTKNEVTFEDGTKGYLTLDSYRMVESGYGVNVMFTVSVYAENYFEQKAEDLGDEYERATEPYNLLYTYTVGDTVDQYGIAGKLLKNGKDNDQGGKGNDVAYSFNVVEDGYVFYSETDINGAKKDYALKLDALQETPEKIINSQNVKALSIFKSLEEVYYVDADSKTVYVTTLIGNDYHVKKPVLKGDKVSSLLYIYEDYLYYYATSGKLARVALTENAEEQLVSEDVVSSTWYDPEIVEVDEKAYMFYCDNSTAGNSYLKFVDLTSQVEEVEDEENEGETYFTLKGQKFLAVMTAKDKASLTVQEINALPVADLEYVINDNGEVEFTEVISARASYDALPKESKQTVSEEALTKLENAEKAQALANYYYKLRECDSYADMSDAEKSAFRSAFDGAKAYRQELIDSGVYEKVREMLKEEFKYYYQVASQIFA